jgi:Asp-tRNA(Asn)/Glu-tRNA(Gln) amidotransferase C subunit
MSIDEQHLKDLIKSSFAEVLWEKRELFASIIEEVMEDMGLLQAMIDAKDSEDVSMADVRKVLRSDR